jgi:hypothetical protein
MSEHTKRRRRAGKPSVVVVESQEPIDFDAWAVRYLTIILELRGHRVALPDAA